MLQDDYNKIIDRYARKFEVQTGMRFEFWIAGGRDVGMFSDRFFGINDIIFAVDNYIEPDTILTWYDETYDNAIEKGAIAAHSLEVWLRMKKAGYNGKYNINHN